MDPCFTGQKVLANAPLELRPMIIPSTYSLPLCSKERVPRHVQSKFRQQTVAIEEAQVVESNLFDGAASVKCQRKHSDAPRPCPVASLIERLLRETAPP